MKFPYKVGLIGFGNLAQTLTSGWLDTGTLTTDKIWAVNRSAGKQQKARDHFKIQVAESVDDLIEICDIVVLAVKPHDLTRLLDGLQNQFHKDQIVISLAAGITLQNLEKKLPDVRLARVIPNTTVELKEGVIGYHCDPEDESLKTTVTDLFSSLGYTTFLETEEMLESLMIACSSGTGFVLEIMTYFQEWLEERGFTSELAKHLVIQTFVGASQWPRLHQQKSFQDLVAKVASKKGVTEAGLESMRELELERVLRIALEKASLRNQELAKIT